MKRTARIVATCLIVCGGAVTLLLWAQLKLVAGIPRTVYAEPEITEDTGHPQPDNTDSNLLVQDKPAKKQPEAEAPASPTR